MYRNRIILLNFRVKYSNMIAYTKMSDIKDAIIYK